MPSDRRGLPRRRITVVDDDLPSLELMRDALETEDYVVTPVDRVSATLDELHASRPDLIIVDLLLSRASSGLTGWDVVRLAKADRDLRLLPVILVSADRGRLRALLPGTAELHNVMLLSKPFRVEALLSMCRRALQTDPSEAAPPSPVADELRTHAR